MFRLQMDGHPAAAGNACVRPGGMRLIDLCGAAVQTCPD